MIGDDIEADVGGAIEAGRDGVLVRSGGSVRRRGAGARVPTIVLDSIAGLVESL
jgi:ribonucleotide monophosphatase NagD (HAD superfamily)